jgi:hypothetical protein
MLPESLTEDSFPLESQPLSISSLSSAFDEETDSNKPTSFKENYCILMGRQPSLTRPVLWSS